MADEDKRGPKSAPAQTQDARQERLANALRANFLKRKENVRARKGRPKGSKEGGQG